MTVFSFSLVVRVIKDEMLLSFHAHAAFTVRRSTSRTGFFCATDDDFSLFDTLFNGKLLLLIFLQTQVSVVPALAIELAIDNCTSVGDRTRFCDEQLTTTVAEDGIFRLNQPLRN